MEFGIVGLGRMGANLARHAVEKKRRVVAYDHESAARERLAAEGIETAASVKELVSKLVRPRIILTYVPHGDPTDDVCRLLRPALSAGDVVGDGGNSHWRDAPRRRGFFAASGVQFVDVGTSGGVSGARRGACFMVGGDRNAFDRIAPVLRDLAVDDEGVMYVGPSGCGHFVKLVHNAIEFGMVQAIADGVELLRRSDRELDLPGVFNNWQHGSVIRGWLVELMGRALCENGRAAGVLTYVEDTGEVKWVLDWALERDIPTPAVTAAQTMLMQSRDIDSPGAKAVALLRHQYGGHIVHRVAG